MSTNLKNRVSSLSIVEKSFTPEGQKEPVTYNQLIIDYSVNKKPKSMALKISPDKADLLDVADIIPTNLLDDDERR